jgi:diguanylate cyclase (GGDEF)-like protein/PAS domain S-box-containing protein
MLAGIALSHPRYSAIWAAGNDGVIFCANQPGLLGTNQSQLFSPATAADGHGLIRGVPRRSSASASTELDYVHAEQRASGGQISVGVSLDLPADGHGVVSGAALPRQSTVALLDDTGAVVYSSNGASPALGAPLLAPGDFARLLAAPDGISVRTATGSRWLYTLSSPAPGQTVMGLRVAAGMPLAAATAAADQDLQRDVLLLLLLVPTTLLLASWGAHCVAIRPLRTLSETAGRLARGDASARAGLRGSGEIGRLCAAFDSMAGELQSRAEQLRQREQHFRALVENSTELVIVVDAQGQPSYISPSVERLLGFPASHFAGTSGFSLLHEDDLERLHAGFMQATAASGLHSFSDVRLQHANGSWRWFDATLNNLLDDANVAGIVCTLHDVTERRATLAEARGARERYQALFEDAPVMFAVIEQRGDHAPIVDCNALFLQTLGYTRTEVIGRVLSDFMSATSAQAASSEKLYLHGALDGLIERERELVTRDGATITALLRGCPEPSRPGEPFRIRAAFIDVTAQRAALEEARQAQQQYRTLFEEAPAMYAILEERAGSTPIIDCNALFLATLGYTREEVIGRTLPDLFTLDSARLALDDEFPRAHRMLGPIQRERDFLTRDGEIVHALLRATPEESVRGRPPRVRAMFVDITGRREAEEALRHAQDQIATVLTNVPIGLFEIDQHDVITLVESGGLARTDGAFSIVGKTVEEAFADMPAILGYIRRAQAGEQVEAVLDLPTISYDARYVPLRDADGVVVGVSGVALDVTERRRAERTLHQVETRLRTAVDSAPLVIFTTDREGVFTLCEGKGLKPLGVAGSRFVGRSYQEVYQRFPDAQENFRRTLAGETVQATVNLDGVVFECRYAPAYDAEGAIAGVVGVALDITAQHRTETTLIETQARLQTVVGTAPIVLFALDADGYFRFAEGHALALLETTPAAVIGRHITDVYRNAPEALDHARRVLAGESVEGTELINGRILEVRHEPLFDAQGRVVGTSGVALDVTERRAVEQELREAQARSLVVLHNVPAIIYSVNREGILVFADGHALATLGIVPADLIGLHIDTVYARYPDALEHAHRALAGETVFGAELLRDRTFEVTHVPVFDADGRAAGYSGIALDMTDRLAAESALRDAQEQLGAVVTNVPMLLFKLDRDGVFTLVVEGNAITGSDTGEQRRHALLGASAFDAYAKHPEVLAMLRRTLAGEAAEGLADLDGVVWDIRAAPVRGLDGAIEGITGVALDVTARHTAEQALRQTRAQMQTLVDNVPVVLSRFDKDGIVTLSEGNGLRLLGMQPGEMVGRSIFAVYRAYPELLSYMRSALAGETIEATVELYGAVFDMRYVPERDAGGAVIAVAGVALDATARRQAEEALAHQAFHDVLTGLPNRALFINRLDQALLRAERRGGGVGLLFLDLDQFKVVNDSLGHTAGDELLIQTAARISACVRAEDTVARLGGDEFTVVVENTAAAAYAAELAERILAAFGQPFVISGREIFATPSIGVACCSGSAADLLRRADVALYQAKAAGRARVVTFDERMDERARARLEMEADLHRAIARGELELFYQPVVELVNGAITGVEALVRWRHPERGLVGPNEFIPLAEETGLILPLGRWVLGEACRQAAVWRAEMPERRLTVAVNLSARQLQDSDMSAQIAEALAASGLPAEYLELELTESMLIGDVDGSVRTLLALRQVGVRLAMDDFGTGYSSLSYLARLPVDTLKIDQSFTRRLTTDSGTAAIVEATVTLAHALGMSITAEGIETPEELARLRALRCERGQGYYFCRPVPAEELRRVLDDEAIGLDRSAS